MFSEGGNNFITLKEAAKLSGYTSDHVARLIRNGNLKGRRIGKIWVTTKDYVNDYLLSQNRIEKDHPKNFINLKDASKISGYTPDHIARLIRTREISGKSVGRVWLVNRDALKKYVQAQNGKHNAKRIIREDIIHVQNRERMREQWKARLSGVFDIVSPSPRIKAKEVAISKNNKSSDNALSNFLDAPVAEKTVLSSSDPNPSSYVRPKPPAFRLSHFDKSEWGSRLNFNSPAKNYFEWFVSYLNKDFVKRGMEIALSSVFLAAFVSIALSYSGRLPEDAKTYGWLSGGRENIANGQAGIKDVFSGIKDSYVRVDDKLTDFLGDQYLKLIPSYSPYDEFVYIPRRSRQTEPTKEVVIKEKEVRVIERVVERVTVPALTKEAPIVQQQEVMPAPQPEKEVIIKEGDNSMLQAEIEVLKKNFSVVRGDVDDLQRDIISRVNTISKGGGLPSIPSDLSSGGTINRLTLGNTSVSGNSFSIESGNILFSTSGTINQTGTGQVTFSGNLDANNGLDVTGNLTVSGTSALTGAATLSSTLTVSNTTTLSSALNVTGVSTFSNATTSFNGVSYGFPSADGTTNQRLTTNGQGQLSWATVTGGGESFFTDGGTFSYLTTTTHDLVLGDNDISNASFFFDVSDPRLQLNTLNGDPRLDFQTASTTRWLLGVDNSDSNKLRITPGGAFNATSSGLTLTAAGYLGIGTTSPTTTLFVAGNSRFGAGTASVLEIPAISALTGAGNSIAGSGAGVALTSGTNNTVFGVNAGNAIVSVANNTFIGYQAGLVNTAAGNTAIGSGALDANTSGLFNTAIGVNALGANTTSDGNTAIGYNALQANTGVGGDNTAVGVSALGNNTTGIQNVAIGGDALALVTTSAGNTAVGWRALYLNTGQVNTAVGDQALRTNGSGEQNVAIGYAALLGNTTANNNVGIGYLAGDVLTTGAGNIILGSGADPSSATANNEFVAGSATAAITNVYFGEGPLDATPLAYTINGGGGSGTDIAGAALQLAGGRATGNAAGGSIIFQTSDAGVSGTTLQSLSTKMTLTAAGLLGISDPSPGSLLTISATGTLAFGDFNDVLIDDMESSVLNWTASDTANTATSTATSTDPSSTAAPKVGRQALRFTTSGNSSIGDTVRKTFSSNQDWTNYEKISFWIYATQHSTSTSQIVSFQINDTGGTTSDRNITILKENRWQYEEVDIASSTISQVNKDSVNYVQFIIDNATSSPTFVVDHVRVYDSDERSSDLAIDGNGNIVITGRGGIELVTGTGNSGQLPNLKISNTTVEVNNPLNINVGGDVGIDYDLQFLNTGTSYITSEGPLQILAGDSSHDETLILGTQGTGDVIIDVANSTTTGAGGFKALGASGSVFRIDPNGQFIIGSASTSTAPFYFNSSARRAGINVYDGNLSTTFEIQDNDSDLAYATTRDVVLTINNASTTSADPYIQFQTASTTRWIVGVDDSDSDKFRIATSSFIGNAEGITILNTSGFVGIGTTNPSTKLQIVGGNCSDDAGGAGCTADLAEYYNSSEPVEKGDIVSISTDNQGSNAGSMTNDQLPMTNTTITPSSFATVKKSDKQSQNTIIGVVSTAPAMIMDGQALSFSANNYILDPYRPAVALAGRVLTKVSAENGPINIGDPITASSIPGVGVKATEEENIIGYALEAFPNDKTQMSNVNSITNDQNSNTQTGKILVFINLGYSKLTVQDGKDSNLTLESLAQKQTELEDRVSLIELKLNEAGVLDNDQIPMTNDQSSSNGLMTDESFLASFKNMFDSLGARITDGVLSVKNLITGKIVVEKSEDQNENTIGEGVIIVGATSTDISASSLGIWDKIFLTPETPVSIGIVDKRAGDGFTVAILEPAPKDVYFDWWIVGVEIPSPNPPAGGPMLPISPAASEEQSNDQSDSWQTNDQNDDCEHRVTYGWNPNPPEDAPIGSQNEGECRIFETSCLPEGYVEVLDCLSREPVGGNSPSAGSPNESTAASNASTTASSGLDTQHNENAEITSGTSTSVEGGL